MYYAVGHIKNACGGPVVLLQTNDLCIRISVLKIENIPYICTSEFVNGLIVITYNAEVVFLLAVLICVLRQKPDKLKLGSIGVLIFINQKSKSATKGQILFSFFVVLLHEKIFECFKRYTNEAVRLPSGRRCTCTLSIISIPVFTLFASNTVLLLHLPAFSAL